MVIKKIQTFEYDSRTIILTINTINKNVKFSNIIKDEGYKTQDVINIFDQIGVKYFNYELEEM